MGAHLELLDAIWPPSLQDVIILLPCALPIWESLPLQTMQTRPQSLSQDLLHTHVFSIWFKKQGWQILPTRSNLCPVRLSDEGA